MIREQDDGLKEVSVAVGTIHDMSLTMQDELAKQKMYNDFLIILKLRASF